MLKRGTIYLLDEPTTGLDNAVARSLQKTLDKLAENASTICITHHLGDLKTSDDVIYLDAGHVVEHGCRRPGRQGRLPTASKRPRRRGGLLGVSASSIFFGARRYALPRRLFFSLRCWSPHWWPRRRRHAGDGAGLAVRGQCSRVDDAAAY